MTRGALRMGRRLVYCWHDCMLLLLLYVAPCNVCTRCVRCVPSAAMLEAYRFPPLGQGHLIQWVVMRSHAAADGLRCSRVLLVLAMRQHRCWHGDVL